jgi:hypothetical protein
MGTNISLWHDWWHPLEVLYEKFGHRVVYDATSHVVAKLSSVLVDKQ